MYINKGTSFVCLSPNAKVLVVKSIPEITKELLHPLVNVKTVLYERNEDYAFRFYS